MASIILFTVCVAAILYAGTRLAFYGNLLAELMGWGKMWMGMILMAAVTSLPELVTGVSAIQLVDSPNMAVGNVIGSCAFNILILSMLDAAFPKRLPLTYEAQTGHVIAAAFGIVLLCIVIFSIIEPGVFGSIGWVGNYSFICIVVYFLAMKAVYNYEKRPGAKKEEVKEEESGVKFTKRTVVSRYILFAALVVVAAIFLPVYGEDLAKMIGIGDGFFGTVFLALSTSLPEVVVSFMAVRQRAIDIAVGNVLGSNVFNIFILALYDIMYLEGPLLENITPRLLVPATGTILITTIGIIGLVYKSKLKWLMAVDSFLILLVYIFMMKVMFSTGLGH